MDSTRWNLDSELSEMRASAFWQVYYTEAMIVSL